MLCPAPEGARGHESDHLSQSQTVHRAARRLKSLRAVLILSGFFCNCCVLFLFGRSKEDDYFEFFVDVIEAVLQVGFHKNNRTSTYFRVV